MILIHKKVHTRRVSVGLAYGMRPSEDGDGPRAYETVSTASPVFATARKPVSRSTTRKRGEHFCRLILGHIRTRGRPRKRPYRLDTYIGKTIRRRAEGRLRDI